MKRKFLIWLTLLLLVVPSLCSAAPNNLVKIADTTNSTIYVDTESVTAITKNNQIYMLVAMEEHYKNSQYLTKLRQSNPNLKQASMRVFLYMFNNNGTQYCVPSRFMADAEGKVCLDLGADMVMKPVNKSITLIKTYETGYSVLEHKQKMMQKVRRGG